MAGKPSEKLKYLSGLNEKDFPFLIGDILSVHYKHNNVKVMDGTGDGKRDIFSLDPQGNKVITQCKFHYDFTKTSGSSETDEIVIALNKFSYTNGFFCTSGKLSPQSKREYLDNYKNFNLNWLEGHEIVDIVLENNILRKIWFENEKIHLVNNKVSIPFILRKLPEDKLFEYEFSKNLTLSKGVVLGIDNNKHIDPRQLFPLNQLNIRESVGVYGSNAKGYVATLVEDIHFNSINDAKEEILKMFDNRNDDEFMYSYLAIRFGIPYFSEKEELYLSYKNEKFNLPENSETYILNKNCTITEYDFLIEVNFDWKLPDRIQMSQLDNYCFYNREIDIVFYLEYTCEANKNLHPHVESILEVKKVIWSKSLFLIVNESSEALVNTFHPDELYSYGSTDKLLCWIHPTPMIYSADINQFENTLYHEEFEVLKKEIIDFANLNNLEIIDWEKASKIISLNSEDPFPKNPETTYRLVDIFERFDSIPSPIKPENRLFNFECVFVISNQNDYLLEEKISSLGILLDDIKNVELYNLTIDDQTNYSVFLRVIYTPIYQLHLSTKDNLEYLKKDVKIAFDELEKLIKSVFTEGHRYTNNYWFEELGIFLDRDLIN